MDAPAQGFVPGKRAHGECPLHPGQPYYHCPECAKARQQGVGAEIADQLQVEHPKAAPGMISDPLPVRIMPRAAEHLFAYLNNFRRDRPEWLVQTLRLRAALPGPEGEQAKSLLTKAEADAAGLDVDGFDALVLVFLDVTGISGIHPKIEIAEPSKVADFQRDYRVFTYSGGLRVAVELRHMNYLRGLVIDWHDRLDRAGFVVRHSKGDWSVQDR